MDKVMEVDTPRDPATIAQQLVERGIAELDSLDKDPAAGRVRRPGAGRKKRSHPTHRLSRI